MSGYNQDGERFSEQSSYYTGPKLGPDSFSLKGTSRASQGRPTASRPPVVDQVTLNPQDDVDLAPASDHVTKDDQWQTDLDTLRTPRSPFQNPSERPPQQLHQHIHHTNNVFGQSNEFSGRYDPNWSTRSPPEDPPLSSSPRTPNDHHLLPSGRHTITNSPRERVGYGTTPLGSSRTKRSHPVVEQDPSRAGPQKGKKSVRTREEEDSQSHRSQQGKRVRKNDQSYSSSVKTARSASQDVKKDRAYHIIRRWLAERENSSQKPDKDDLEELARMTELSHGDLIARLQGKVDFAIDIPRHLSAAEPNLRVTYSPYYQSGEAYAITFSAYPPETIDMIVQYFKSKWDGGCGSEKEPNARDKYPCYECGVLFVRKRDWKKHLQDRCPHKLYFCSEATSKARGTCNSIHHRHFNEHLKIVHGILNKEERRRIMTASLLPPTPFSGRCGYCGALHTDLDAFYNHVFDDLKANPLRNDWVREWPASVHNTPTAASTATSLVDPPHADDASASQSNSVRAPTSITSFSQQLQGGRHLQKGKQPAQIVPSTFSGSGQEPSGARPHSASSTSSNEFGEPFTPWKDGTGFFGVGYWVNDV